MAITCIGIVSLGLALGIGIVLSIISLTSHYENSIAAMKIYNSVICIGSNIYMFGIVFVGCGLFTTVRTSRHGYHIMATYIMMIFFGIVSIVVLMNDFVPNVRCLHIVNNHTGNLSQFPEETRNNLTALFTEYKTTLVANSSIIVAVLLIMYLHISLKDHRADSCFGKLLSICMAASCISIYLYTFVQETMDNLQIGPKLNVEILMEELQSNDTKLRECLAKESTLHKWDESTKQYFPCLIEFSVIAFGLAIHLWRSTDDVTAEEHSAEGNEAIGDDDTGHPAMKKNCLGVGVILAIIIIICWCYFQTLFVLDKSLQEEFMQVVQWLNITCYTLLLLSSAFLFFYMACSCKCHGDNKRIAIWNRMPRLFKDIENVTLLICGLAVIIFSGFRVYSAGDILNNPTILKGEALRKKCNIDPDLLNVEALILLIITDLIDIAHLIIQTIMLVMLASGDREHSRQVFEGKSRRVLKPLLAFLAICNLGVWLDGSFIESNNASTFDCVNMDIIPPWEVISVISYPLILFYRIHSMFLVLKVIDKLNALNVMAGGQGDEYMPLQPENMRNRAFYDDAI